MEIKVKVKPGARREKFVMLSPKEFEITVREKALENAANRRVVELVALHFEVPKSHIRVVRGHHARTKILSVA